MTLSDDKRLEELLDYLTADEKISSEHRIGLYDVVTTTERVICLKKFPRSFIEIKYADIDNLEHLTRIRWNELMNSAALIVFAGYIYMNDAGRPFVEPLSSILDRIIPEVSKVLPVELTIKVIMGLAAVAGFYHIVNFLPSMMGYFRISRKGRAPVIIATSLTPELKNLIREIDERMKQKMETVEKLAVEKPGAAPAAQPPPPEMGLKERIEEKVGAMADNAVILISSKSEDHTLVVSNALNALVNKRGMGGVYISVSRPSESITSTMDSAGIPAEDVYFIDCISQMAGKGQQGADSVVFVENASSLEEITMYLDRMLTKVQSQKKFLFLDSLSSLLIYNTEKSVKEFTHFLINKIRLENIAGVILSIEKKEAEDLFKTLTPMCDTAIIL
jgi:archaellum biogenesis ATPase FlaH